jgi:hypothetical protein
MEKLKINKIIKRKNINKSIFENEKIKKLIKVVLNLRN